MQVCNCMDISYDEIKNAVKKCGFQLEDIQDETEAGTVCECCLENDCDIVDISLPEAILKAKKEIEEE